MWEPKKGKAMFLWKGWYGKLTAVYQLALNLVKSFQNSLAENLFGTITVPPERSGARKPKRLYVRPLLFRIVLKSFEPYLPINHEHEILRGRH